MTSAATRPLRKILGLGFGVALVFGTVVGVGILRLPGTVAAALGDPVLIMAAWALGGLFSLMGAMAVAELAAMIPESGGFRVYARRAFGERVGFAVGWMDWLCYITTLAYAAVAAGAFLGILWPPVLDHPRVFAALLLTAFAGLHWLGLEVGRTTTAVVSTAIGLLLMVLVVGCFVGGAAHGQVSLPAVVSQSTLHPSLYSAAMALGLVTALRAVLTAYDGWYAPIYLAEENTNATRNLPRAIIGGSALVVALYLVINLAFLYALPMAVLAGSTLPAADAARLVLPRGGAAFVTVLSLCTVLSNMNSCALAAPRILYALGRDGFLSPRTAVVSAGGTPRVALIASMVASLIVVLSGSFEQIIAMFAVLFLLVYISAFLAVLVLRRREPGRSRPYRSLGYPWSTGLVLAGSVALLIAATYNDPRSGLFALIFLACCVPVYWWLARGRRRRLQQLASLQRAD